MEEKRIELKVDNVMVSDRQATMTIVLNALDGVDTVELTGLLFSMMHSAKKVYQDEVEPKRELNLDQAEAIVVRKLREALNKIDTSEKEVNIQPIPQETKKREGNWRKWTPEELARAQAKRKATLLKKKLENQYGKEKSV